MSHILDENRIRGAENQLAPEEGRNFGRRFRDRPPPPPSNQSLIETGIGGFEDRLGEINPQFFDIGQSLIDRGMGTATDPLIEMQRERGIGALRAQLSRRGITGSVGLNQIGRANLGFDEQALGRRDQSLGQGFGLQSIGLQNLLAGPTARTALLSAQRSGQVPGGGGNGGGLLGSLFGGLF